MAVHNPNSKEVLTIARKPTVTQPERESGPRVNEQIELDSIRLIDAKGQNCGVQRLDDALALAEEAGLDLVEIQPKLEPPVCKIMDYGKFKYEKQKRASEAKKKRKTIVIKEVKLRPNIDQHDYEVKMKSIKKFIGDGNKVKVTMRFRGREMVHQELGNDVLARVTEELTGVARVEAAPELEGRQMVMVLSPDRHPQPSPPE